MNHEQLEPPGTIGVIGAGAMGIEAALYGRSLGYCVRVLEAEVIGHGWNGPSTEFLRGTFKHWSSPLGLTALMTQDPQRMLPGPEDLMTYERYRNEYLLALTESDLLEGSVREGARVVRIDCEPLISDDDEAVPADDLRVVWQPSAGNLGDGLQSSEIFECVIVATGPNHASRIEYPQRKLGLAANDFATGIPYLFQLGDNLNPEYPFLAGLDQIVRLYASLAGRAALNLYR